MAKTELNEAQAVLAMAYGRMPDSATQTRDDVGAALGHLDRHWWEMPLTEAARTLQDAGARVAKRHEGLVSLGSSDPPS